METNYTGDTGHMPARSANRRAAVARPRLDGRSVEARRAKHWRAVFTAAVRGAAENNPLIAAQVERAAVLCALAERARVAALASGGDADAMRDLMRAEKLVSSACESLGYFRF
jgi:hypothetical protein